MICEKCYDENLYKGGSQRFEKYICKICLKECSHYNFNKPIICCICSFKENICCRCGTKDNLQNEATDNFYTVTKKYARATE